MAGLTKSRLLRDAVVSSNLLILLQGSAAFLGGLFLVLIGWPFIGMIVEAYGFISLFRSVSRMLSILSCFPVGLLKLWSSCAYF
jgi:hypothetical protein